VAAVDDYKDVVGYRLESVFVSDAIHRALLTISQRLGVVPLAKRPWERERAKKGGSSHDGPCAFLGHLTFCRGLR
jgi:hypothetical protein